MSDSGLKFSSTGSDPDPGRRWLCEVSRMDYDANTKSVSLSSLLLFFLYHHLFKCKHSYSAFIGVETEFKKKKKITYSIDA